MDADNLFQSFHFDSTTEEQEQIGRVGFVKRLLSSRVLYRINVGISVIMCGWVGTLFLQLCKEAFTRTSYRFVPYPREVIGLFSLMPLYKTDVLASAIPVVMTGAVLLSWVLFLTGFLVPGAFSIVLALYIPSYYLCEKSTFGYGFKETSTFQHAKSSCINLLVFSVVHYLFMRLLTFKRLYNAKRDFSLSSSNRAYHILYTLGHNGIQHIRHSRPFVAPHLKV